MNSVNVIGRLEKDPKLIQTKRGRDILRFLVKLEHQYQCDEEFLAKSYIVPCFARDQKAVDISTMKKGHRIAITGHLQSHLIVDSYSNSEFYAVEIFVDRFEPLTAKSPKYIEQTA